MRNSRNESQMEEIMEEGRMAFLNHGESGEVRCPYDHGPPMDERRTWWFDGFLALRTRARLERKGVAI